ncbi:hypothetical protein JCM11251_002324 [Rhodosporidiobolus azoricus]
MAQTSKSGKLIPLWLSSITSTTTSTLPARSVCRGKIASVKPWSTHTRLASITLAPVDENDTPETRLEVELKGWWAEKASRRFRVGEVVILRTVGAKVLVGSKKGKEKEGSEMKRRVRFEKELYGWVVRRGGEEEVVRYRATDSRPAPTARAPPSAPTPPLPLAERPQGGPPAAEEVPTVLAAAPAGALLPPKRILPPELTAKTIPAKRPAASPPKEAVPTPAPAVRPAVVSAAGEGARSVKRRKQEEKLGWGCEANDETVYTAFDGVGEEIGEPETGGAGRKFVNIIALVHEVGGICPPRKENGDYYRKLTVVCPSRPSPPVELQWYSKSEAAIPALSSGDVLVARGLAVKGSPFSSSFVAGSLNIVPFSILDPSSLLLPSGPTQHPDPAPPAPACPPGVNAWTWKNGLSREVAYGVQCDEEELKYAARVVRFFRKGGAGVGAAPSSDQALNKASPAAAALSTTAAEQKVKSRVSGALGGGRPLVRIEEIEEGKFCDLIAMVIKFHNPTPTPVGSIPTNHATELYLTDYTSHPSLFTYDSSTSSHSLGVSLPGQLILRVSLFGYQSEPLRPLLKPGEAGGIQRGTLLHLRNLRVKENGNGVLEGTMVEEKVEKFRYKRDVTVLSSGKPVMDEKWREAMKGLQRRHREFWAAASTRAVKR